MKLRTFKDTIPSEKETIKNIALQNNISPKTLYGFIKTEKSKFRLPNSIPVGIAHKSLKVLSGEYIFDVKRAIAYMQRSEIKIDENVPFKKVAKEHSLHPATLYSMLLASQED